VTCASAHPHGHAQIAGRVNTNKAAQENKKKIEEIEGAMDDYNVRAHKHLLFSLSLSLCVLDEGLTLPLA
jgi:hypothetical protein